MKFEVATELAEEIAEGVPAEEVVTERREEIMDEEPKQIEVGQDEDEEEKKRREKEARGKKRMGQFGVEEQNREQEKELKEQVASLTKELNHIKREASLQKLASEYSNLWPQSMREAKANEILGSADSLDIVKARIQEASNLMKSKTNIKYASMGDGIFSLDNAEPDNTRREVSLATKL